MSSTSRQFLHKLEGPENYYEWLDEITSYLESKRCLHQALGEIPQPSRPINPAKTRRSNKARTPPEVDVSSDAAEVLDEEPEKTVEMRVGTKDYRHAMENYKVAKKDRKEWFRANQIIMDGLEQSTSEDYHFKTMNFKEGAKHFAHIKAKATPMILQEKSKRRRELAAASLKDFNDVSSYCKLLGGYRKLLESSGYKDPDDNYMCKTMDDGVTGRYDAWAQKYRVEAGELSTTFEDIRQILIRYEQRANARQ
jgi:hypothetical protein